MYVKNIRQYKCDLRLQIRGTRKAIPYDAKAFMDSEIKRRFFQTDEYRDAEIIFTYVSKPNEIDTLNIISEMLESARRVAVPKCIPEICKMDFYEINSLNQLKSGCYGVLEPDPKACRKVPGRSASCVCLVPGLSFDAHGYRLGYGKGYYDRFLSNFGGSTIGLCYCSCMREELPRGHFDRPVNIIITEKYVKRINCSL